MPYVRLCVALDQKLTLSTVLSRIHLIWREFFPNVANVSLLLFVPKIHDGGYCGTLILTRVLERILPWYIMLFALQDRRSSIVRFRASLPWRDNLYGCYSQAVEQCMGEVVEG